MSNKLPSALIRSLIEKHGIEEKDFLNSPEGGKAIASIRLNKYKASDAFSQAARVPWCPDGRYLDKQPFIGEDPLFHAGCYYVQDASSMFLEQVLKHTCDLSSSNRVLDVYAARGERSALISSLLSHDSLLVSNETSAPRRAVLAAQLAKCGPANMVVSNNETADFAKLSAYFDIIVVDAPSSASARFRENTEVAQAWSEPALLLAQQRQQQILADVYPSLKKNGILIYSTSSFTKDENEAIADWLCDTFQMRPAKIPLQTSWRIEESLSGKHQCYGYRFDPLKVKGEGFFIAAFRKTESAPDAQIRRGRRTALKEDVEAMIYPWLKNPNAFQILNFRGDLIAIPEALTADVNYLNSHLSLEKTGVRLGKLTAKGLVPHHELALSLIMNPRVQRMELKREEAIAYLKRNELSVETNLSGWTLICYQGHALGWARMPG
jgi:16S rRNA C967 or C1407 C5-methylase (RsmB/RsmF family)/NOL1/NOP2/fmu family ribosome biogenesis protein